MTNIRLLLLDLRMRHLEQYGIYCWCGSCIVPIKSHTPEYFAFSHPFKSHVLSPVYKQPTLCLSQWYQVLTGSVHSISYLQFPLFGPEYSCVVGVSLIRIILLLAAASNMTISPCGDSQSIGIQTIFDWHRHFINC